MNTALLLIEIQNDYFPQGKIPLEKGMDVALKAQAVLRTFREKKSPVVYLQQISTRPDASYLLPCTKGAEFHPHVQPEKNELIIKKHYPNGFRDTTLLAHLKKLQVKHLLICGMMTHLAVDATARAAYDFGFSCSVLHDACTTHDLRFNQLHIPAQNVHHAFLAALHPTYAALMSTEECLQKIGNRAKATVT